MKSLQEVSVLLRQRNIRKKVLVVCAHHEPALCAIKRAYENSFIEPILLGMKCIIRDIADRINFDISNIKVLDCPTDEVAMNIAVEMMINKAADILMKGVINSGVFLSPILKNLNPGRRLIHHSAIMEIPGKNQLTIISDVAIQPIPGRCSKVIMVRNNIALAQSFGILDPSIAIVCASEKRNERQPATVDAYDIVQMNLRGEIPNCKIYGPIAIDCVDSEEAARTKGLEIEAAGHFDIEIHANLEAGNIRYKDLIRYAHAISGCVIMGFDFPVIVTSRSDGADADYYSLVVASLVC